MRINGNEINQRLMSDTSSIGSSDDIRPVENSKTIKSSVSRVILGILTLGVSEGVRYCISQYQARHQSNHGPRLGGGIGNPLINRGGDRGKVDLFGSVANNDIVNNSTERGRARLGIMQAGNGNSSPDFSSSGRTFKS